MSIKGKLISLVSVTIGSMVVALCLVGYFVIHYSGNRMAREQLVSYQQAVQKEVDERLRVQETLAGFIRSDAPIAEALGTGNVAYLKERAKSMVGWPVIDLVTICDSQGKVLARGHLPDAGDVLGQSRLSAWVISRCFILPRRAKAKARAWAPGLVLNTVAASISPRSRRTQAPSLRSMAG